MAADNRQSLDPAALADAQRRFLAVKGRIEGHAHRRFAFLHGEAREEAVAETLAFAWKAYRQLCLQGRNPDELLGGLAAFCALRVLRGDRLAGRTPAGDALSRGRRRARPLPHSESEPTAPEVQNALEDTAVSPADQAAFNVDLHDWLAGLEPTQRQVALELAGGAANSEIGARRGRSRGWTNLVRRELRRSWEEFNAADRDR